jgi:RNA polymerase sigma factor (sigma-70 family)
MVSFPTTRWTLVLNACGSNADAEALSELCAIYWRPVYAFLCGKVRDPEQARDLTQSFFVRLLEKRDLVPAYPDRVRFRCFLLRCVQHFLSNEQDRARAQKRGGGVPPFPLEFDGVSVWEPVDALTPEMIFEKQWAVSVVDRTLEALRSEEEAAGKGAQFATLEGCLADEAPGAYARIGDRLGMTEGAVKVAVYRLRRRLRQILRQEIAATVSDPDEIEDEVRYLFSVISS